MQCRAVARRCPLGSITVLGDLAQATAPWAAGSWRLTLTHLGQPQAVIRPLTIGYRVPGEVLEVANQLLPHIAPDVPPASSVRAGGDALTYSDDLTSAVRRCLAVAGSIAVIAADARVDDVLAELATAGIATATLADELGSRVTVVPATAAKGLEYDSVVLIEPAEIVAAEPTRVGGLRRLYVTWTRAVSRLAVVHQQPLPAELSVAAPGGPRGDLGATTGGGLGALAPGSFLADGLTGAERVPGLVQPVLAGLGHVAHGVDQAHQPAAQRAHAPNPERSRNEDQHRGDQR